MLDCLQKTWVIIKPHNMVKSLIPLSNYMFFFLVCFVALRPKSTAMVIAGRSVHLTTLFPGQAESAEGRRMTVEIIS